MELARSLTPSIDRSVTIRLTIPADHDDSMPPIGAGSLRTIPLDVTIETGNGTHLDRFFVEQDSRGAIDPAIVDVDDGTGGIERRLSIVGPETTGPTLRLYLTFADGSAGPFTVTVPAPGALATADELIHGRGDTDRFWSLTTVYDETDADDLAFALLGDLDEWLHLDTHFQLLDGAIRAEAAAADGLTAQKTAGFLATQIASPPADVPYPIASRRELEQAVSTCNSLEQLPDVDVRSVLVKVRGIIRQQGSMDDLWRFERRFDVASDPDVDLLWDDQVTALLVRSLASGSLDRARDIVDAHVGSLERVDEVEAEKEAAMEASGAESLDAWRKLLPRAATVSDHDLRFVGCNYVSSVLRTAADDEFAPSLVEASYGDLATLADSLNVGHLAEYARYEHHVARGQRHLDDGEYESAVSAFDNAVSVSLRGTVEERGGALSYSYAIMRLYETKASAAQAADELERAVDLVATGRDLLAAIDEPVSERTQSYSETRLTALEHELAGDRALADGDLATARQQYGKAIECYGRIDHDHNRAYLEERNTLLRASVAEQRGDFRRAGNLHRTVAKRTDAVSFEEFNRSRADVCDAKAALVDRRPNDARELIRQHRDIDNVAGVEARHVDLLLDLLEAYRDGEVLDVGGVFDDFDELASIRAVDDEFPFEYGHDYRPALSHVLAAQRLRALGVDDVLVDELVNLSLRDVLAPDRAEQRVAERGMADVGLRRRWRYTFPLHLVRRFAEIESNAVTDHENYSARAFELLKLVEQALEFVGDFFVRRAWGSDWQARLTADGEGDVSLGNLRDMLDTDPMADCLWTARVAELLDRALLDRPDVIAVRNAIAHDKLTHVGNEGYEAVKDRVEEIFALIAQEVQVPATLEDRHPMGVDVVRLHWDGHPPTCHLRTDATLRPDRIYYLPPDAVGAGDVVTVEKADLLLAGADRVTSNLPRYLPDDVLGEVATPTESDPVPVDANGTDGT